MKFPILPAPVLLLFLTTVATVQAGENAAPSSHMVYDNNFRGDIIINGVRVPEDGEAMYTYYETLGWRGKAGGYAGIQAHPKAHNYIFSIWDHKEHTAPIRAVHHGAGTKTEKFGGEGTGLKSWNFELGWDTDVWYTLASRCWPVGDHTFYGFWVRSDKTGEWRHLVTMDVAAKDAFFEGGNDAFIEDWLETGKNARTSHLRGAWKRKLEDRSWHASGQVRYSVNHWDLVEGKRSFNFRTNWDGGVGKDKDGREYFYMIAGGKDTKPTTANPSKHKIARDPKVKKPGFAAVKIATAKASAKGGDGDAVEISWTTGKKSLPQFSYKVEVFKKGDEKGQAIVTSSAVTPHARSTELKLPAGMKMGDIAVKVTLVDILDNVGKPMVFGTK